MRYRRWAGAWPSCAASTGSRNWRSSARSRGDAGPDSDVDLLYARVPGNDLGMGYFELLADLERLLGHHVDLVAKDGLHRVIRDRVLADAQLLYTA